MSFSGRLSSTDLQTSAFSRRDMLGKLFATAVATAAAKPWRVFRCQKFSVARVQHW